MSCTTPQVAKEKAKEFQKFLEEFGDRAKNFTQQLNLPSILDPSVLGYTSKSRTYLAKELLDPDIVKPVIKEQLEKEITAGSDIKVDTSAIINDLLKFVIASAGAASVAPTFGGFRPATYSGLYSGKTVEFIVILATFFADATKFHDPDAGSVLEFGYFAYLTMPKA